MRTTRADVILLFPLLRTRCIAGKKTVEFLTYTGIKRRAQTEFNRSAAALRCQCSFAKSVRDPFGITFPAFALQPGKTLIGTVQTGALILIHISRRNFWTVSPAVEIVSAEGVDD